MSCDQLRLTVSEVAANLSLGAASHYVLAV